MSKKFNKIRMPVFCENSEFVLTLGTKIALRVSAFVKNHKKIFKKTFSFCHMCDIFVTVRARKRFSGYPERPRRNKKRRKNYEKKVT